jgi:hypothetical protein
MKNVPHWVNRTKEQRFFLYHCARSLGFNSYQARRIKDFRPVTFCKIIQGLKQCPGLELNNQYMKGGN